MIRRETKTAFGILGWMVAALLLASSLAGPAAAHSRPVTVGSAGALQGSKNEAKAGEDVYTSDLYGYTLTYDPADWQIYEGDSDPQDAYDQVLFINSSERSLIAVIGDPDYQKDDMSTCVTEYVAGLENRDDIRDVAPMDIRNAEGEEADRAWATHTFTAKAADQSGKDLAFVRYTECRWLGDSIMVAILHNALAEDYAGEINEREAFLEGLAPAAGNGKSRGKAHENGQAAATVEAVFRGGQAHSGEQPGPGPEGDLAVAWSLELPPLTNSYSAPVSPTLADGKLYVLRQEGLYAVDAASGKELWLVKAEGGLTAAPVAADGLVYFTAFDGIYAVDASSGDIRWRVAEEGGVAAPPSAAEGQLYVVIGDGTLLALDGKTGKEIWRFDAGTDASPTIVDGVIYLAGYIYEGGPDDGDVFWAIDAESGKALWHLGSPAGFQGPAAVIDGTIFAGGDDGVLTAIDAASGKRLWQYAGEPSDEGGPDPVPAVADGMVYYGSWDGTFVALDAKTGDLIWNQDIGGVAIYPVVVDDSVYVFPPAKLLVLDAATGEQRAELDDIGVTVAGGGFVFSEELIQTSPLIVDGVIYVVLEGGVLAIEGNG